MLNVGDIVRVRDWSSYLPNSTFGISRNTIDRYAGMTYTVKYVYTDGDYHSYRIGSEILGLNSFTWLEHMLELVAPDDDSEYDTNDLDTSSLLIGESEVL